MTQSLVSSLLEVLGQVNGTSVTALAPISYCHVCMNTRGIVALGAVAIEFVVVAGADALR